MTNKDTKVEQPKQDPILPVEVKKAVSSIEQKTAQDTSLEKMKADIAQLKKDNEVLQSKQTDFEKNKTTLSKEERDKLKQEIETEAKRIEARKMEILTLIKQTKQELANLKGTVETGNKTTDLDAAEKEVQAIKVEKSSRFGKAREGTKNFVSEHKQGLLIGGGIIGGRLLLRSLFKRKHGESSSGNGEKKESRWGKWLKRIGIATGVTWLGRGLFTGKRDLFGWNPFSSKKSDGPETTPGSNIEKSAQAYESLTQEKKAPYENLSTKINEYYGNAMNDQAGVSGVEEMLGDSKFEEKNGKKIAGLVPFVLANRYADVGSMLKERAFYYEIIGAEGHIARDKLKNRSVDELKKFLLPLAGTVDGLTSFLGGIGATKSVDSFLEGLKALPNFEATIRTVFRKSLSVMSYFESRRRKLEHQIAMEYLSSRNEDGFNSLSEKDKQKRVADKLDDDEWYAKNVKSSINEFLGKSISESIGYMQSKNILDGEIDPLIKGVVEKVEERRKDLLGIEDADDESKLVAIKSKLTNGKLSPEAKEKLQSLCEKFEDDIDGFGRKSWYNQYLPLLEMFNVSEDTLQKMQATGDYDGVVKSYKDYITSLLKKSDAGTLTSGDIDGLENQVNDYYKFQKSLVTTQLNLSEARDNNKDVVGRRTATFIKAGEVGVRGVQMVVKGDVREKIKGGAMVAGAAASIDLITYPLRLAGGILRGKLATSPTLKIAWKLGTYTVKGGAALAEWITGRAIRAHLPYGLGARWYNEDQLRYAICNGEIDLEKAVKIANRKGRTINPENKNAKIISSVEDLFKRFTPEVQDEKIIAKASRLLNQYRDNPDIYKQVFDTTYEQRKMYRPKDWLKLDKKKIKFSINEINLNKLEAIDLHIQGCTNPTEKKIFESMMKYTKDLNRAESLVNMGIDSTAIKLFEKGGIISAEKFGNYLAKYAGKIDANEMKAFQQFLLEAKGKMGENAGLFVRNSLKNFEALKKEKFAIDQIEKLGLKSSKWTKLAETTKANTSKMISGLEGMVKNPRFKPFWKGIEKQISSLKEYKNTITPNGLKAMKDMNRLDNVTGFSKLSDEGILAMNKISYLLRDVEEGAPLLKALQEAKDVEKVKEALLAKGVDVAKIDESILAKLAGTKNGIKIKEIVNYGAEFKAISGFKKLVSNPGVKMAGRALGPVLSVVELGFVGAQFSADLSEAQKIKMTNIERGNRKEDEAYFEVTTGTLGALAGACMFIPGAGWIAAGAMVAFMAIKEIGSSYYKDIEKFKQNYADFVKMELPEVKQRLVTVNAWGQGIDRSFIEKFAGFKDLWFVPMLGQLAVLGDSSVEQKAKGEKGTTNDAIKALMYLEEIQKNPRASLDLNSPDIFNNPEAQQQVQEAKKSVDAIVKKRFEYIQNNYIAKNKPIIEVSSHQNETAIASLDHLLEASTIYNVISQDESYTNKNDVAGYIPSLENHLKQENAEAFKTFENLFASKKSELFLFYAQLPYYKQQSKDHPSEEGDTAIQRNIEYFEKYIQYKMMGKNIGEWPKLDIDPQKIDYNPIHEFLSSFVVNASKITATELTERADFLTDDQLRLRYGVSLNIGQNILFDIATKGLKNYTGQNDLTSLKAFFNEGSKDVHGVYCSGDERFINEASSGIIEMFGNDNFFAKDTALDNVMNINKMKEYIDASATDRKTSHMIKESSNNEYAKTFAGIINEHLGYRNKQAAIRQQLIQYIKQNATAKEYIKLPLELVLTGTKAGISGLGACAFRVENNTIRYRTKFSGTESSL